MSQEQAERRTPSYRELAAVSLRIERIMRSPIPREEPDDSDDETSAAEMVGERPERVDRR